MGNISIIKSGLVIQQPKPGLALTRKADVGLGLAARPALFTEGQVAALADQLAGLVREGGGEAEVVTVQVVSGCLCAWLHVGQRLP